MSRRPSASLLLLLPVGAWVGSVAWLLLETGPASTVIHEGGERTLIETILYPRHFLREVPVAVLYALGVAHALGQPLRAPRGRRASGAVVATVLLLAASLAWVVAGHGVTTALADAGQYFTHDDRGAPGAHWGGHFLSNLVFLGCAWIAATPWREPESPAWPMAAVAGVGVAAGLSFGFRPDAVLTPWAAGHQVREIATHVGVTLPLALVASGRVRTWPASPRSVAERTSADGPATGARETARRRRRTRLGLGALLALVVATLSWITLTGGALHDSPAPWSSRVAGHLLEHAMDQLLVVLLVVAACRPRETPP